MLLGLATNWTRPSRVSSCLMTCHLDLVTFVSLPALIQCQAKLALSDDMKNKLIVLVNCERTAIRLFSWMLQRIYSANSYLGAIGFLCTSSSGFDLSCMSSSSGLFLRRSRVVGPPGTSPARGGAHSGAEEGRRRQRISDGGLEIVLKGKFAVRAWSFGGEIGRGEEGGCR